VPVLEQGQALELVLELEWGQVQVPEMALWKGLALVSLSMPSG
jgi:hypothetical protein